MYCVTVFLFVPFVFRALIVLFWQQHNLNFKPNRRVRKCVWCAATARAYLPIYVQTWITQIYASNGLKLTTDLSTWHFNFTKQDRKRKKNPFFFFFFVVRSSIFFHRLPSSPFWHNFKSKQQLGSSQMQTRKTRRQCTGKKLYTKLPTIMSRFLRVSYIWMLNAPHNCICARINTPPSSMT